MKEELVQLAFKAQATATAAAKQAKEFAQAHAPTHDDMARAKVRLALAGHEAAEFGREVAQSKAFKDGARGAAVGAVAAIPIPFVGSFLGAVVGAGVGVFLGRRAASGSGTAAAANAPKDLHDELLKLDDLRQRGLLTDAEFEVQKRKLLAST